MVPRVRAQTGMRMKTMMRNAIRGLLPAVLAAGLCCRAAEPGEWAVRDATIRFVVGLTRAPSHPSAGFFVKLPDGGSLPGPFPETLAFDEAGNPLTSAVLWHAKEIGCAVVFAAPKEGKTAVLYVRGAKKLATWTPASGLTPSAIRCEVNGTSAKAAAQKLSRLGSVDAKTHFHNQAWSAGTWQGESVPMAVCEWKPGGNAIYLLAHIEVTAPGPTWVAPMIRSGAMEIVIDGKPVPLSKKNEKQGGLGGEVNLTAGLHRVELFGFSPRGQAVGPMMFTWRTPKTTMEELGGPRASDLRYPGTSMYETAKIKDEHVVKTGDCTLFEIQSQTGLTAAFEAVPDCLFALEGEEPRVAYTLKAWTKGNPKETRYSWSFEEAPNALADGPTTHWLFKGSRHSRITLTAEAAGRRATCTTTLFAYTFDSSSLDDEETRHAFKRACYSMLKAYPEKADPTAAWDDAMLNNLFRVLDLSGANLLVETIVTQRWPFFKKRLTPERQGLLEDIFLFSLGPRKPQEAIRWALKLSSEEFSSGRAAVLKLKAAEVMMFYLNDLAGARKLITPLLRDSGEAGEWAKIRMGDLEFLERNINAATQRYGDVQSRAKATAASLTPKRLSDLSATGAARARRSGGKGGESGPAPMAQPADLSAWKLSAIRDAAASEQVNILIEQGFYLEAFQALQAWERIFPLSKLTGDYLLCEAKLYRALKDSKRARVILSAYCDQVDASNFLVAAMELNKQCMMDLNEPAEVIEKYTEEIRRRTFAGGDQ